MKYLLTIPYFVIHSIDLGFYSLQWPIIFTFVAVIAVVWAVNFFNFLDGIDGYIGTEVVFIGISAYILTGEIIGLVLAASVGGFLILNWQKAKIFMGDVGSTLLGFIVAILAIYYQNTEKTSIVVWLILTSVFWFDATITLLRRIRNKEKLSQAHRNHAYQRIVQSGRSHQKTVLFALLINAAGFCLAFLAMKFNNLSLLFLLFDIAILTVVLRYVDGKKPFSYLK